MALNITSPIELPSGITLATSWGRVGVADNYMGNNLQAIVEVFASEADFEAGKTPVTSNFTDQWAYDRATDGTDILDIAHDHMIGYLAGQGITATKVL